MNILEEIMRHKRAEVAQKKRDYALKKFEKSPFFSQKCLSLKDFLCDTRYTGIIAEFKKRSPSRPDINLNAKIADIIPAYCTNGAAAISVLTDEKFFGGTTEDLNLARYLANCPILRKDFFCDEWQILEAKAAGADAVLLIAAVLSEKEIRTLSDFAFSLQMQVLLELHDEAETVKIPDENCIIGINNRNLQNMQTDVRHSFRMLDQLPKNCVKVSESGISSPQTLVELKNAGYNGFLIGEFFMKDKNPGQAFKNFVAELSKIEAHAQVD